MKYTIAIAALMAVSNVEALDKIYYYRSQQPANYAQKRSAMSSSSESSDYSSFSSSSSGSSSYSSSGSSGSSSGSDEDVQAKDDGIATEWNEENPHPGFEVWHHGFEGQEGLGYYNRTTPEHFQGPGSGDDQFMHSMITNYALELATPEGKKTGEFVFKRGNAKAAAYEILDTHLGLQGKEAEDYLNKYFDKTFDHFDTAGDGMIEADRMSGFFRFLCGNMQIDLH